MTDKHPGYDALVLGAGGSLGFAWMQGVLGGWEQEADVRFAEVEHFVGTSAGSIMGATLAAGLRPDAYARALGNWSAPSPRAAEDARAEFEARMSEATRRGPRAVRAVARGAGKVAAAAASPFAPFALGATAPGGAALRAAVLARGPQPRRRLNGLARELDKLPRSFSALGDGKLRVVAVEKRSGKRVVFGSSDAPDASIRDAVLASCSVPWIFAPVKIGDREYVDGGVWTPTNLDAAPVGRKARVLCLVPTASGPFRAVTHAGLLAEMLALKARGAEVRIVTPDADSARVMGVNLMDPRRSGEVLEAAYRQGRRLGSSRR